MKNAPARERGGGDTDDCAHVDPRFGGDQALDALMRTAHEDGSHVILDGVFHSSGIDFFPFRDLRERGAASHYRDWYTVYRFPLDVRDGQTTYQGWLSVWALPKLNLDNSKTRQYMLNVGVRWIDRAHIDGWRLDSADQAPHSFWRDYRKAVRAADPEAFLVGEIWGDATAWLQGDQFDSVMDYRWRGAALDFFAHETTRPREFAASLARIWNDYPTDVDFALFNLLGSHDTERLRTACGGDWSRERQAVLFQMTYPGVPCIYYGDEVGVEGKTDPDCRRCMPWNEQQWDQRIYRFFRSAVALRRGHAIFQRGLLEPLLADDASGLYGFVRRYRSEKAAVLFNRDDVTRRYTLAGWPASRAAQWLGDAVLAPDPRGISVTLPPRGIAVIAATTRT